MPAPRSIREREQELQAAALHLEAVAEAFLEDLAAGLVINGDEVDAAIRKFRARENSLRRAIKKVDLKETNEHP